MAGSRSAKTLDRKLTTGQEAMLALLTTADTVYRSVTQITGIEGLSLEQYNVLRILQSADSEGLATLEISRKMIQRAPGMTLLLDKLEKKKLVKRKRDSKDRRRVICQLTQAGHLCVARLTLALTPLTDGSLSSFNQDQQADFLRFLTKIRESVDSTSLDTQNG